MNERIQELWEQAVHGDGPHASVIADFAELIVQDCLGMIENEASTYAEPVWAYELVNDIKERFGVEE